MTPDFDTVAFDVARALDDGDVARACDILRRFPEHADELTEMIGDALMASPHEATTPAPKEAHPMTIDELETTFERHADAGEYIQFERIEKPRHPRPDICAFLMLHDLLPGTRDMVSAAEHDEIWLDIDLEALAAVVTDSIVRDLVRCGVHLSDDRLAMFT